MEMDHIASIAPKIRMQASIDGKPLVTLYQYQMIDIILASHTTKTYTT
jgi:hypothetical protein